jgi:hypothetical protein
MSIRAFNLILGLGKGVKKRKRLSECGSRLWFGAVVFCGDEVVERRHELSWVFLSFYLALNSITKKKRHKNRTKEIYP